MLASMSNAVVTINEDGIIATCNKAGLKIFRVSAQEIVGKTVEDFFQEAGLGCWRSLINVMSQRKTLI